MLEVAQDQPFRDLLAVRLRPDGESFAIEEHAPAHAGLFQGHGEGVFAHAAPPVRTPKIGFNGFAGRFSAAAQCWRGVMVWGKVAILLKMRMNGLVLLAVEEISRPQIEPKIRSGERPNPGRFSGAEKGGFAVGNSCRLFCATSHNVYYVKS